MIKLFSRFQIVRIAPALSRVGISARGCAINSPDSKLAASDQFADLSDQIRLTTLSEEYAQSVKYSTAGNEAKKSSNFDDLFKFCESMPKMLDWVERNLFKIKSNELPEVYVAIDALISDLNRRKMIDGSLEGSLQILRASSTFELLLNHTNRFLNDFDSGDLVCFFRTFQLVRLDPRKQIVRNVMQLLNDRLLKNASPNLNDFKLISSLLRTCHYYLISTTSKQNGQLLEFNKKLLTIAKLTVLDPKFDDPADESLNLFQSFLMPQNDPTFEVVSHLSTLFLASKIELDFRKSVYLLSKFILGYAQAEIELSKALANKEQRRRLERGELYPNVLSKLIDHCNAIIYPALSSKSNQVGDELAYTYHLIKLHATVNQISKQFKNFYDPRLLEPLSLHLLQYFDQNERYKYLAFNLVQNYARIYVYDERMLNFIYNFFCNTNDRFRSRQNPLIIYSMFSKIRLPFVNHHRLATEFLFNFSNHFYRLISSHPMNALTILTKLILTDVYDQRLYTYLNEMIKNRSLVVHSVPLYQEISLARNYLLTFGELTTLKLETSDLLNHLMSRSPIIDKTLIAPGRLSKVDNKIRPNAYLSNGIYLKFFAIYDRTCNDLVPLNQHMNLFYQVDSIPLRKGQQL